MNNAQPADDDAQTRRARYDQLSNRLARLTDEELAAFLTTGTALHSGVGGRSAVLTLDGTPIFVKMLPLADLERRPEHCQSTANIFDIPLCCHYGHGGPGFNAWRELAATVTATSWVRSGACANFPLLYHWRVLPCDRPQTVDGDVDFWLEFPAVRTRLDALRNASASLLLFLEYIPQNLLQWLGEQVAAGAEGAEGGVALVDAQVAPTIDFMHAQGVVHFDTHFENILCDGRRLYFGDFGLALSSDFALTDSEVEFLARHQRYDYGRAAVGYAHCLSATCFGNDRWKEGLRAFVQTGGPPVPAVVAAAIRREAPLALAVLEFSRKLREESKQTRYPIDL